MIGGTTLRKRVQSMPEHLYMKYYLKYGLLDPFRDEDCSAAIVEFREGVDLDWIQQYFENPMAAAIDCRCKAIQSVDFLTDFEHSEEKGQNMITQIEDITNEGYFETDECCKEF